MIFTDSNRKFDFEGDILDMTTNYEFNASSIEQPKVKELLLVFLDQMRSDFEHGGNKSIRTESLLNLSNLPAIRSGSFKNQNQKWVLRDFCLLFLMIYVLV